MIISANRQSLENILKMNEPNDNAKIMLAMAAGWTVEHDGWYIFHSPDNIQIPSFGTSEMGAWTHAINDIIPDPFTNINAAIALPVILPEGMSYRFELLYSVNSIPYAALYIYEPSGELDYMMSALDKNLAFAAVKCWIKYYVKYVLKFS